VITGFDPDIATVKFEFAIPNIALVRYDNELGNISVNTT
jgi:hypothetical protein